MSQIAPHKLLHLFLLLHLNDNSYTKNIWTQKKENEFSFQCFFWFFPNVFRKYPFLGFLNRRDFTQNGKNQIFASIS